MNHLLELLREATGRRLAEGDFVMHRNVGSIPAPSEDRPDHISTRGFNLQVLDARRRTTHYVKIRPRHNDRAKREASLLNRLGTDSRTAASVPASSILKTDQALILVLDFLQGPTLHHAAQRMKAVQLVPLLERTLDVAESIADVAQEGVGHDEGPGSLDLLESSAWARQTLSGTRLTSEQETRLEALLTGGGSVPIHLQHGDLTAWNVVLVQGRPVLLDFEAFGEGEVPLFDAWNLLRSIPDRSGHHVSPSAWWRGPLADAALSRASAFGFGKASTLATLAWFLTVQAATLMKRGVPEDYIRPCQQELEMVIDEGEATLLRSSPST